MAQQRPDHHRLIIIGWMDDDDGDLVAPKFVTRVASLSLPASEFEEGQIEKGEEITFLSTIIFVHL